MGQRIDPGSRILLSVLSSLCSLDDRLKKLQRNDVQSARVRPQIGGYFHNALSSSCITPSSTRLSFCSSIVFFIQGRECTDRN